MLTLEQCRRIDPDLANLPDEELLALRDKLYAVANVALDSPTVAPFAHWLEKFKRKTLPVLENVLSW